MIEKRRHTKNPQRNAAETGSVKLIKIIKVGVERNVYRSIVHIVLDAPSVSELEPSRVLLAELHSLTGGNACTPCPSRKVNLSYRAGI